MKCFLFLTATAIASHQLTTQAFAPTVQNLSSLSIGYIDQVRPSFRRHLSPEQASELEQAAHEQAQMYSGKEDTIDPPKQTSSPLSASSSSGKEAKSWWSKTFKKFISRRG